MSPGSNSNHATTPTSPTRRSLKPVLSQAYIAGLFIEANDNLWADTFPYEYGDPACHYWAYDAERKHWHKCRETGGYIEGDYGEWQCDERGDPYYDFRPAVFFDLMRIINPWRPRQAAHDAPWSSLYEANKSTIGGDPNKISPGMSLSMPGGGTHVVQSGETLSGIANTPAGTDLGQRSLSAERGGVSPTGGDYSSGGQQSGETGGATSVPSSSAPTPPVKPAEYGGAQAAESPSSSSSETPTPPVKPASLGGTGESPEGLNPQAGEGGGVSPTGSEGTGLAKFVRGLVGEE